MKNTLLLNEAEIEYLKNLSHLKNDEFFVISQGLIKEGKKSKAFYLELSDQILNRPLNQDYKTCLIFNLGVTLDMFKDLVKRSTLYDEILKVTNLQPGDSI